MTRYTFADGKITVEAGVYVPLLKRDRRISRDAMLALITKLPCDEKTQTEASKKENPHVWST